MLMPPDGYIVSFVYFHERGLASPPHRFFRGLLHHYKTKLQHLNPNRIQHISVFIGLYEGYLGVDPHFELWKYFFVVDLQRRKEDGDKKKKDPDPPVA